MNLRVVLLLMLALGLTIDHSASAAELSADQVIYENVNKRIYKRAVKNADSGDAADAYLASWVYRRGWLSNGSWMLDELQAAGRDFGKARLYLEKAAALSHAGAHFELYECYANLGKFRRHAAPIDDCDLTSRKWHGVAPEITQDPAMARFHLEEAARLNYRHRTRRHKYMEGNWAEFVLNDLKSKAMERTAGTYYSEENQFALQMFPDVSADCDEVYDDLLLEATQADEATCSRADAISQDECLLTTDYISARTHMENCMEAATTEDEFDHYFTRRMKIYSVFSDVHASGEEYSLLHNAKAKFLSFGNHEKASKIDEIIEIAKKKADATRAEYRASDKRARNYSRASSAQREQEKLDEARELEEWQQQERSRLDADRKWLDRTWNSSTSSDDDEDFWNGIKATEAKAMDNIRAGQVANDEAGETARRAEQERQAQHGPVVPDIPDSSGSGPMAPSSQTTPVQSRSGNGGSNLNNHGPRLEPVFAQKEGDFSWATQEEACRYATNAAKRIAEAQCRNEFGGRTATKSDIEIPVDANCHSYRQIEETGLTSTKGHWKASSNVILQCRLP